MWVVLPCHLPRFSELFTFAQQCWQCNANSGCAFPQQKDRTHCFVMHVKVPGYLQQLAWVPHQAHKIISSCNTCLQTPLSHALLCCQHFSAQWVPLRSTSLAISSLYSTPLTCNTTSAHYMIIKMPSHSAQGNCSHHLCKSKLQLPLKQSSWHCVASKDAMSVCLAVPTLLRVLTDAMANDMMQPKASVRSV